ncbi:MAG TPA: hypothetical protein VGV59_08215, partial [Pyrinomonadaceae bacterium]|nr:hypothetical protein [Pyrinomonadaceae bacterium]
MFICNQCGCALADNTKPCTDCGAAPTASAAAAAVAAEVKTEKRARVRARANQKKDDAKAAPTADVQRRAASAERGWWRRDRELLLTMLVIKLFVLVFGVQAYNVLQNASTGTFYGWLEIWNRWDAPHYLDIARDGYTATGEQRLWIVFHPLYPWVVRACAFVVRDYLIAS